MLPTVFLSHPQSKLATHYGEPAIAALRKFGQLLFNSGDGDLSCEELSSLARDADVIVSYRQTVASDALFAALPRLKAFVRCAIDIRNVDLPAASRHGVLVTQASAGFVVSVSEWVVGTMIDLGRGISAAAAVYHAGGLPVAPVGRELRGSVLGVIGFGRIGRYLCDVARVLGMRLMVHDPFAGDVPADIVQVSFAELLRRSDFVVCLAAATESTENMMNADAFATMQRHAFFINASRGNLVDEAALLAALDSGAIAGCALDVGLAPDQMPSLALARHARAIATPHIGGLTPQAIEHQAMETVAQVEAILQGRVPAGAVNALEAHRWRSAYRID
jgi:D-3-phosphoglycerate dehydrogenase / 2-oxoglutarate reductase